MQDYSSILSNIRGTVLRCLDESECDSLDTSISTEGENTPTPSPGLPMSYLEFENLLIDLVDHQRWGAAIAHVKQFKQLTNTSSNSYLSNVALPGSNSANSESFSDDIPTIITKIYSQRLTKDRNGK